MERAVTLVRDWCAARTDRGPHRRRPAHPRAARRSIVVEVPATDPALAERTVLLYGHLDKQPEMTGWRDGLGPWTPVIEGDRLYGRGGADDGYAAFAVARSRSRPPSAPGCPTPAASLLIEASEESGSPDLPAHLDALADRHRAAGAGGLPRLRVRSTPSGCGSRRRCAGLAGGVLTVEVLTEGVHSGEASGVVPSSFRIIRQLLDRIEDAATGRVLLDALHVEVPTDRLDEARRTAAELTHPLAEDFPFAGSTRPMVDDPVEQLLARTWRPTRQLRRRRRTSRRPVGPATCCARPRRCRSASACRRRATRHAAAAGARPRR